MTYTIGFPKNDLFAIAARPYCGTIVSLPISFSRNDLAADYKDRQTYLVQPDKLPRPAVISQYVHKYTKGAVCVVGGSLGKIGAAAHSGLSALAAGAGIVSVLTNDDCLSSLGIIAPELVCDKTDNLDAYIDKYASFVIGPGLCLTQEQADRLSSNFCKMRRAVADASFFTTYTPAVLPKFAEAPILTPHVGELMHFFGVGKEALIRDTIGTVRRLAAEHKVYLLLKSAVQYLAAPDGVVYLIDHPTHTAAQAGSGDILAGLIGALLNREDDKVSAILAAAKIFYEVTDAINTDGLSGYDTRDFIGRIRQFV